MAFNITFDYRFDESGFYTSEARHALESAAKIWQDIIRDEFQDVAAGHRFEIQNPETGEDVVLNLDAPIDDLLIFVGSRESLPGYTLGRGGYESGSGASVFARRLQFSDFEPYIGSIYVDRSESWFFDQTPDTDDDIPADLQDFITLALHEIGHVLGIGTAKISNEISSGGSLSGYNTQRLVESYSDYDSIPVEDDGAHFKEGLLGDSTLMDPTMRSGIRTVPSAFDRAWLADIGYSIADFNGISFEQQGVQPPLATAAEDRFYGTSLGDELDALAGNDSLSGLDGNDQLNGGNGDDQLWGGVGDDHLLGGQGDDSLDGEEGNDHISGGSGNDSLWGSQGGDVLIGDDGNDQLSGQDDDDRLDGGADADKLWGGLGNDYLWGGDGNDYLQGDEGNDALIGWSGDDNLWGSSGADVFVFGPGQGRDVINDFDFSTDIIELDPKFGFIDSNDVITRILIEKPYTNVSRVAFDTDNYIDIFHDSMQGTPLDARHFRVSADSLGSRFDFGLSTTEIRADIAAETTVAEITLDSPILRDTVSFELVSGEGDTENERFRVDEQSLVMGKPLSWHSTSSFSIRLRATAKDGYSIEKAIALRVEGSQETVATAPLLDITGDGDVDATDGYLLMRHLLGTFPGTSLTDNITGLTGVESISQALTSGHKYQGGPNFCGRRHGGTQVDYWHMWQMGIFEVCPRFDLLLGGSMAEWY